MFLLWPDPPRTHKRRLVGKAVVHVAPEATARGVGSRRVPLLPIVPPIRRGLGPGVAVARAGAILDSPRAPAVVSAPTAVAEPADLRPPAIRARAAATGHAAEPVAVRSAPASLVALRAPRALRRVFARPDGPPFLSDRTPECHLLFLLSSATMDAAARAERALHGHGLTGDAARLVAEVGGLAFGSAPLDGFWGDEPCVDSLRLRRCRSAPAPTVGWEGFYWWAGRRLGPEELSRLPPELLPDAAAALAAVQGPRRAFELLAARAAWPDPSGEAIRATRRLALRCALSGVFVPSLVRFLLPSVAERGAADPAAAWEPAILALHAYRLAGQEAGTTHVAAALVSTIVRDQVGRIVRRSLPEFTAREWGAPALTPEREAEYRQAVVVVGTLFTQLFWSYEPPWPRGWSAPDVVEVEHRVSLALGERGVSAYDVFMDDTLAVAACHALLGHTPSARATLASTRTPEVFASTRQRLSRWLERGPFDPDPAPVVGSTLGRDFQGLLERLRNTPDPADFGAPDWRRPELRGRLLSRLQQRGPRGLALALRTLLGQGFAELDRFWLAPSVPRSTALGTLAAWLDRLAPLVPTERDFVLFLDERCRRMAE